MRVVKFPETEDFIEVAFKAQTPGTPAQYRRPKTSIFRSARITGVIVVLHTSNFSCFWFNFISVEVPSSSQTFMQSTVVLPGEMIVSI